MDFRTDINRDFARRAFDAISHRPDKRGDQTIEEYQSMLEADYHALRVVYEKENALDQFDAEFNQYRAGFRQRFNAWLSAKSRCMSSMITGPARFPVRRAEKANQSEDNRWRELQEFRARAKKAIIKKVQPYGDGSRIVSHDPEAVAKLREKLDNLKKSQETMKAANRIIRSKSTDHDTKLAKLRELGIPAAETLFKPDFCGRVGFADYQLQNNNANIKRVEARIKELSAAPEGLELEKGEVRIFEGDGRIQVEFPGKPPESTRSTLKRNGFKWSPSRGTWVRMANGTARNVARLLLDEIA